MAPSRARPIATDNSLSHGGRESGPSSAQHNPPSPFNKLISILSKIKLALVHGAIELYEQAQATDDDDLPRMGSSLRLLHPLSLHRSTRHIHPHSLTAITALLIPILWFVIQTSPAWAWPCFAVLVLSTNYARGLRKPSRASILEGSQRHLVVPRFLALVHGWSWLVASSLGAITSFVRCLYGPPLADDVADVSFGTATALTLVLLLSLLHHHQVAQLYELRAYRESMKRTSVVRKLNRKMRLLGSRRGGWRAAPAHRNLDRHRQDW